MSVVASKMTLSVVIGTRNRLEILRKCLDALIGKIDMNHEIVVVDAGSTDGTLEYLDGLKGIRLVCDGKPIGQAQSLNRVFRTITSKYVCWLSDDNVVLDGMLDLAAAILEHNPDIGLVALKTKDVSGPFTERPYLGGTWPPGILNCNQGMLRTELLRRVGGFDEEFRDYGIDADLTTKVLLMGYKVVYTKRLVIHHYRSEGSAWIDPEGRELRLQAARDLYNRKYAALIQSQSELKYRMYRRLSSRMLYLVQALYHLADRASTALEQRFGYSDRDWNNVLICRFISNWDLIINLRKPYYLVQQIPEGLQRRVQICLD